MSRLFYHTMQDNAGNLLFDVSGTMRLAGTGTLATIYGDEALTVILPNPMTNHPSFASFKCFLPTGDFDFYMAKSGYTFETLTGIQGYGTMAQQDAHNVQITGGTALGLGGLSVMDVSSTRLGGPVGLGVDPVPTYHLRTGTADSIFSGRLGIKGVPAHDLSVFGTAAKTGGGTWADTSSRTLKTNIVPIVGALALLLAQRGVQFEWTEEVHAALLPGPQYGLILEEVTVPQWHDPVREGSEPTLTTRGVEALVIEALRELAQQVQELSARLAAAGR